MEEKRSTPSPTTSELDLASPSLKGARAGIYPVSSFQGFCLKLWRGKWTLITAAAAFTLMALMLSALKTPLYRSQTSIEIQAPSNPALDYYLQTQVQIIQSRSLLERTLSKLTESERSSLFESPRFWWSHSSYDQNIEALRHNISARPVSQAGMIDVSVLSPDAVSGAHFLNSLMQELADYNVERSWRTAQHGREWTDRQLDDLRHKWEQSEQVFAEYSQASGMNGKPKIVAASATTLQPETNDLLLSQLRTRLATLNKQLAQWQSLYGAANHSSQQYKAEIAATESSIRQRRSALARTAPASTQQNAAQRTLHQPSNAEVIARWTVLKQEAENDRQIYEAAAAHLKEAALTSASHIDDISVVDPAIPDSRSVTPNQLLNGTFGALSGLIVGGLVVSFRDRFSRTFSDPGVLNRYLGAPVLGTVPSQQAMEEHQPSTSGDPVLSLAFDHNIETAEAYRSIRSAILFQASHRSGPRRLVFTSADEADGKTSVVGNLGAALASSQRRVLLVDGDLRDPGLHKLFGTDNEHGLADLLSRQITSSPVATRDVIRETQIPDLYLLSAGQAGARAPEILYSAQLPQLISEFAKGFDIVLIDCAPVLPHADVRSLARAADGVVMVVKARTTERRSAALAMHAITQDGASVVGTILTDYDTANAATA